MAGPVLSMRPFFMHSIFFLQTLLTSGRLLLCLIILHPVYLKMSKMISEDLRERMIQNAFEVQNELGKDHAPVVKLYSRYGRPIWLLSELDAVSNIAFGICDLAQGTPELSYVSIEHLESIKHARLRVPMVEADPAFKPQYPMSVYLEAARMVKRITDDEEILKKAVRVIKEREFS